MNFGNKKRDIIAAILIFIIAFFLTADPLIRPGQPATFDGLTHITTMAQFYTGLSSGQFPVVWADGFANYGMPIPLIAHQTTNYAGALVNFLFHNILLSYNIVLLLGAFFSTFFFYLFLRCYFKPEVSFLGAFFFNFSSYRIINIYIRGALPEFFSALFIPLILIGLYLLSKKKTLQGSALLIFSTAMLLFSHPFIFIICLFLVVPYALFLLLQTKKEKNFLVVSICSVVLGGGLSAIYAVPLITETKYFYYGLQSNHLIANQFLSLNNYFDPNWYYYYKNDVFVRGNFLTPGVIETLTILLGVVAVVILFFKKQLRQNSLLAFAVATSLFVILFTTSITAPFYQHIDLLGNIQHPWRLLGALLFLPPLILCILVAKTKQPYTSILIIAFVILISLIRFPQLYGKNYTVYPEQSYFFTPDNLHGNVLNTVWTGKTSGYPIKKNKPEIIGGKGKIVEQTVKNGFRKYKIEADTSLQMVDYTFYFPGWRVYLDGQKIPVEYQNPSYRGVITYAVPQGTHDVRLAFEPTKERVIGMIISFIFLLTTIVFLFVLRKISSR